MQCGKRSHSVETLTHSPVSQASSPRRTMGAFRLTSLPRRLGAPDERLRAVVVPFCDRYGICAA